MKLLFSLLTLALTTTTHAVSPPLVNLTDPFVSVDLQQEINPIPELSEYVAAQTTVATATVSISSSERIEQLSWQLPQTELFVLLSGKLLHLREEEHPYQQIFDQAPQQSESYEGLVVTFTMKPEADFQPQPLWIYNGKIRKHDGTVLAHDNGRLLEYWLFGTATDIAAQLTALNSLPVFTFDQCTSLRHRVVNTLPRQCVMPNTVIMLEAPGQPVLDPLTISTFEDCLANGIAIIDTFPRRCVTKGGKLIPEPPRRPDGSVILPGE